MTWQRNNFGRMQAEAGKAEEAETRLMGVGYAKGALAHAPSGQMVGHIEVIDGRWAASMEVVPDPLQDDYQANGESLVTAGGWRASRPHRPSTPRVLLYDIEADPLCLRNVNAQYPEELAHYTDWLETRLTAHQELARLFKTEGGAEVNAEQMEALRLLGYVD